MVHQTYIPRTRLFVQSPLGMGQDVVLDEKQAHYLRNVLRFQPGAQILLFNGQDGEWLAQLEELGKKSARASIMSQRQPQWESPDIWALFAPVKKDALDFMVEKAVELGASRLCPVMTERCEASRVNLARMTAQATEAAEQCERLDVPGGGAWGLKDYLKNWPKERILLMGAEVGEAKPLAESLQSLPSATPLAVLVGPEGGFSADEHEMLSACPFARRVSLGPRILRAETALIAMLSVVEAVAGDWRRKRAES